MLLGGGHLHDAVFICMERDVAGRAEKHIGGALLE